MEKWTFTVLVSLMTVSLFAENIPSDTTAKESVVTTKQTAKHLKEQMKREEHFAKTQSFAQGDDYNLTEHQVDPNDLTNVPVMEPQYDLNMDDAYD
jgi:hypothetical protein